MELTTTYQRIGTTNYTVIGTNELRLYAKYNSQDYVNNKTSVTFQLRTIATSGYYTSYGNYSTLNCDGDRGTQYYDIGTVDTSSEKTIGTWTFDLYHNNDGTYSGSVTSSANVYGSITPSVTALFTLKTILRQSELIEKPTFTMSADGNTQTFKVNIKKNNPNFYDILRITSSDGQIVIKQVNGVTEGEHTYTFTQEERNRVFQAYGINTVERLQGMVETWTSQGGTNLGYGTNGIRSANAVTLNYTISTTATMEETVTAYNTYKPSGHNNDTFIANLSKPKFTLTTTSSTGSFYGRSVTYKLGNTPITSPYTENNYTGQSFTFNATDGRKTTNITPSFTKIPYFNPTLTTTISRVSPTSDKINISVSGTYYDGTGLTNLATPSLALVYTESGGSQVSTTISLTTTTSGNTVSFTGTKQLTGMNYKKSVQWATTLTDKLNRTISNSNTLSAGLPLWNGYKVGDDQYFNVNGNATISGSLTVSGKSIVDTIYPVGSIYMAWDSTSPASRFGGTWTQLKQAFIYGINASTGNGSSGNGTGTATNSYTLKTADIPSHTHKIQTFRQYGTGTATDGSPEKIGRTQPNADGGTTWTYATQETGGGGGHSHNIPYIAVFIWRRTA